MPETTCPHCNKTYELLGTMPKPKSNQGKEEITAFIAAFNEVLGTKYRPNDNLARNLNARLKEGYSPEDIMEAVKNAAQDDFLRGDNENGRHYLTPEYILRPNKLQEWLNAKPPKPPSQATFKWLK